MVASLKFSSPANYLYVFVSFRVITFWPVLMKSPVKTLKLGIPTKAVTAAPIASQNSSVCEVCHARLSGALCTEFAIKKKLLTGMGCFNICPHISFARLAALNFRARFDPHWCEKNFFIGLKGGVTLYTCTIANFTSRHGSNRAVCYSSNWELFLQWWFINDELCIKPHKGEFGIRIELNRHFPRIRIVTGIEMELNSKSNFEVSENWFWNLNRYSYITWKWNSV